MDMFDIRRLISRVYRIDIFPLRSVAKKINIESQAIVTLCWCNETAKFNIIGTLLFHNTVFQSTPPCIMIWCKIFTGIFFCPTE